MSNPYTGARVQYCGHDGWFPADIYEVEGVNVVVASGPVTMDNLQRPAMKVTHLLVDFPKAGVWRPHQGIFVVPSTQVKELV